MTTAPNDEARIERGAPFAEILFSVQFNAIVA